MRTFLKLRSILADQQGATAIIVGLMLIVIVGFLALAIDGGYVWVAQNELQNAADAGAHGTDGSALASCSRPDRGR